MEFLKQKIGALLLVIACLFIVACEPTPNAPSDEQGSTALSLKLHQFIDITFDAAVDRDPMWQTRLGLKKDMGKWTDFSDAHEDLEFEIRAVYF